MRVGSLFTGIGGFDIAAEAHGHSVVYQSENDKHASKVLRHRWPDIPNLGDIHDIRTPPPADILCGGFPCQDYSVAGKRAGLSGDRGALWWEFHRIIRSTRPTWVIGENVPGLLYGNRIRDFETIIASLTECGYGVVWAVLDAQYFGVAQRRRRLFIVGHSGGIPRPEVLALSQGLFGYPEPSREEGEKPTSSLTSRIGTSGPDAADAQAGWLIPNTVGALRTRDYKGPPVDVAEPSLIAFNSSQDPIDTGPITDPLDANSRASKAVAFAANQRDEVRELEVAGALAAEPGMKQQTFLTSPSVRRLTPLECERLQGFPDYWTKVPKNSDTQRYRQLGNAVAVPVVSWIFSQIANADPS